jgi:hypothetical protein
MELSAAQTKNVDPWLMDMSADPRCTVTSDVRGRWRRSAMGFELTRILGANV